MVVVVVGGGGVVGVPWWRYSCHRTTLKADEGLYFTLNCSCSGVRERPFEVMCESVGRSLPLKPGAVPGRPFVSIFVSPPQH